MTVLSDRRLLLWLSGALLLLIAGISLLRPAGADADPRPTTWNTGPAGAKAAFLTLERMGVPVFRLNRPLAELDLGDAPRNTLVLAQPLFDGRERAALGASLHRFLEAGGRVLLTEPDSASLLGGQVGMSHSLGQPCRTEPEGPGPLAATGSVEMPDLGGWQIDPEKPPTPLPRVEQRCGPDAVVVRLPVGAGEAIWWSSSYPLTNAGLRKDGNLPLLLASLGPGRAVLFDESLHNGPRTAFSVTGGLPLRSLLLQTALLAALLVFSFSRRRGPLRAPLAIPRSSPLEFAQSMGDLYRKAHTTAAALEPARRRLEQALEREAHLPRTLLRPPHSEAIASELQTRFGGNWTALADHLAEAYAAADAPLRTRSALALVQALHDDADRLRHLRRTPSLNPSGAPHA